MKNKSKTVIISSKSDDTYTYIKFSFLFYFKCRKIYTYIKNEYTIYVYKLNRNNIKLLN